MNREKGEIADLLDAKAIARFVARTARGDGCWLFRGYDLGKGYRGFTVQRDGVAATNGAHRVAWMIANGRSIPPGLCVCHHCDNPQCVRPSHLFLGTVADNNDDKIRKGRAKSTKGDLNGRAVMTACNVVELRRRYACGEQAKALRAEFGISRSQLRAIVRGQQWREAGGPTCDAIASGAAGQVDPRVFGAMAAAACAVEIPSAPGYYANHAGVILSSRKRSMLDGLSVCRPARHPDGYLLYDMYRGKKRIARRGHVLVAEAFLGPRTAASVVRHLNGDPSDNRLSNLARGAVDRKVIRYPDRLRRGDSSPVAKLTAEQVREIRAELRNGKRGCGAMLARRFGVSKATISLIKSGEGWAHLQETA